VGQGPGVRTVRGIPRLGRPRPIWGSGNVTHPFGKIIGRSFRGVHQPGAKPQS
jgi:hypothetical protein